MKCQNLFYRKKLKNGIGKAVLTSTYNLCFEQKDEKYQGPVVQSVVSFTSSLVVKMLNVLVSRISNSQVFLLKNMSSFCKCSHFSAKNISIYNIFND